MILGTLDKAMRAWGDSGAIAPGSAYWFRHRFSRQMPVASDAPDVVRDSAQVNESTTQPSRDSRR
jgi:hypothetical protein